MTNPEYLTSRRSLFKLAGAIGAATAFAGTLAACSSDNGGGAAPGGETKTTAPGGESAGTMKVAMATRGLPFGSSHDSS